MKPETLKKLAKKITWFDADNVEKIPFSQGYLALEVIKRYKIPAKRVGYNLDVVGVETRKGQQLFWKDTGIGGRFLGIVNPDGTVSQHPDDEGKQKHKVFETLAELRAEVKKRNYDNIRGLKAKVTEKQYYDMLECMPPLKYIKNGFVMREATTDQIYEAFTKIGNEYYCEMLMLEDEEIMKLEAEY